LHNSGILVLIVIRYCFFEKTANIAVFSLTFFIILAYFGKFWTQASIVKLPSVFAQTTLVGV